MRQPAGGDLVISEVIGRDDVAIDDGIGWGMMLGMTMEELLADLFGESAVRTVDIDGKTWMAATDVARALGHRDAGHVTRLIDPDQVRLQPLATAGGMRELTLISEPGLYEVLMSSRAPAGRQFREWVFKKALPMADAWKGVVS